MQYIYRYIYIHPRIPTAIDLMVFTKEPLFYKGFALQNQVSHFCHIWSLTARVHIYYYSYCVDIYLDLRNDTFIYRFNKKCHCCYVVFFQRQRFLLGPAETGRNQKDTALLGFQTASLGVQRASFPVHGF